MVFAIATNNKKKLAEIKRILDEFSYSYKSLADLNLDIEIEETGKTFEENAYIKASEIAKITNMPAIADDSGLSVDILNGAPGVFSARYAGEHGDDEKNNDLLLENLKDVKLEDRKAKFISAVCLAFPNGEYKTCLGECEGYIGFTRKGNEGFGYDPIFMVGDRSFAEFSAKEKDAISHRGKALNLLKKEIEALK